jgi:hypothetical protein
MAMRTILITHEGTPLIEIHFEPPPDSKTPAVRDIDVRLKRPLGGADGMDGIADVLLRALVKVADTACAGPPLVVIQIDSHAVEN